MEALRGEVEKEKCGSVGGCSLAEVVILDKPVQSPPVFQTVPTLARTGQSERAFSVDVPPNRWLPVSPRAPPLSVLKNGARCRYDTRCSRCSTEKLTRWC